MVKWWWIKKPFNDWQKAKWNKTIALFPSDMVSQAGITCWPSELSLVYECMASTHVQVS